MIYDYHCNDCNLIFEIQHSIHDDPEIKCKKCNSLIKRIIYGGSGYSMKESSRKGLNKTKFSNSTPSESAKQKASKIIEESNHQKSSISDPYYQFR